MKLNKSNLNAIIHWGRSKNNSLKKSEIIDKILKLEDGEELDFRTPICDIKNNIGQNYRIRKFSNKVFIRNMMTGALIELECD